MVVALQAAAASLAAANHLRHTRSDATSRAPSRSSLYLPVDSRAWSQRQRRRTLAPVEASSADVGISTSFQDADEQPQGPPTIELQFLSPVAGEVQTASAVSGEKLLRTLMIDNKFELYDLWGKAMNCGGGGSCGTCIVQILEGQELLNDRTDAEYKYLKKKPNNWRLSCQTIVGDKTNSGKVVVQRLPQKKK